MEGEKDPLKLFTSLLNGFRLHAMTAGPPGPMTPEQRTRYMSRMFRDYAKDFQER